MIIYIDYNLMMNDGRMACELIKKKKNFRHNMTINNKNTHIIINTTMSLTKN